ncbi:MAG: hypothetical protein PHV85_00060 [Desulfovibrionaceae bacterium]|nr:hypothetical protein [Desulfovibrionaceae bacterium]
MIQVKKGVTLPSWWRGGVVLGVAGDVERAEDWLDELPPAVCARIVVCAVNDAIHPLPGRTRSAWPRELDVAASLHHPFLYNWCEARRLAGLPGPGLVLSNKMLGPVDIMVTAKLIGSSGFLPVLLGRAISAEAVFLSGVELSGPYSRYQATWAVSEAQGLVMKTWSITPGWVQDFLEEANGLAPDFSSPSLPLGSGSGFARPEGDDLGPWFTSNGNWNGD